MAKQEKATLGGGCFWCLEAVYLEMEGVLSVESGYMGGHVPDPSYRDVCGGDTGHAEVVQVTFDPDVTSYGEVLEVFFEVEVSADGGVAPTTTSTSSPFKTPRSARFRRSSASEFRRYSS